MKSYITDDMIHIVPPILQTYMDDVQSASGDTVTVRHTSYIICAYICIIRDAENIRLIRARTISEDACMYDDMRARAYDNVIQQVRALIRAHNIRGVTHYCTCGTRRGSQDGYTLLNDKGDWGCARCRKPSRLVYDGHILQRELHELGLLRDTTATSTTSA